MKKIIKKILSPFLFTYIVLLLLFSVWKDMYIDYKLNRIKNKQR
jgi:hypothetical protein